MTQEQLCAIVFPEVLDAGKKETENHMLDLMLRNIRDLALKHHSAFEDELRDIELPEWCSREEALKRMYSM